jgi:hypothetical protein
MGISARKVAREIARQLKIEDGDVILIKTHTQIADSVKIFEAIRKALGWQGKERCMLIVVDEFDDLKVMKEKHMNEYGWYRREHETTESED